MVWNNSCYQSICPVNPEQRQRYNSSWDQKVLSSTWPSHHLLTSCLRLINAASKTETETFICFFVKERNIYVRDFFLASELCLPGVYLFCNWAISSHQSRWKVNILFDNTQISHPAGFQNECWLWKEFVNSGQVLWLLKAVGKASVSWRSKTRIAYTPKMARLAKWPFNNSKFPNFFTRRIWPHCWGF